MNENKNYKDKFTPLNDKKDVISNQLNNKTKKYVGPDYNDERSLNSSSNKYGGQNTMDVDYGSVDNDPDKYKEYMDDPVEPDSPKVPYTYQGNPQSQVVMNSDGTSSVVYNPGPSYMGIGDTVLPPNPSTIDDDKNRTGSYGDDNINNADPNKYDNPDEPKPNYKEFDYNDEYNQKPKSM